MRIAKKHKNTVIAVLTAVFALVYLYAFFMTGIWHNGTFLYEKDGVFSGADEYAEYTVKIDRTENGANIDFYLNDELHRYEVKKFDEPYAEIYENGVKIFGGQVLDIDGGYLLTDDESGKMQGFDIVVGDEKPEKEDLLPTCSKLYSLAENKPEKRGNPVPAVVIIFAAIFLFIDIKFPMLFFHTRHGFDVDGGEPSDWYLFKQQASRFVMIFVIALCAVLTFTVH